MVKFYFKPLLKRPPPVKARRFFLKAGKERFKFIFSCTVIMLLIIIVFGEAQLRPIIKNAGGNALKNELTMLLNQGVRETLQEEKTTYNNFVEISYSQSGQISAITSNTIYINQFKAKLSDNIAKTVDSCGDFSILVPWGTLFGSELFSDKGLELEVESSTYGFAVADVSGSFESVGVNQTLHRIYIDVELCATAYIGNYKIVQNVKGEIPLAETVIVGNVPNGYYTTK